MRILEKHISKKKKRVCEARPWVRILAMVIATAVFAASGVNGNAAVMGQAGTDPTEPGIGAEPTEPNAGEGTAGTDPGTDAGKEPVQPTEPDSGKEPTEADAGKEPVQPTEPDAGKEPDEPTEPAEPEKIILPEASVKLKDEAGKNALISWTRVKGAVSYEVQRATKKDGNYKAIAALGSNRRAYTDKDVARGNYYYYRVAAVMEDGAKRYSGKLTFACPLSQVSGVKLIRYSTSSIKVEWKSNRQASCYKIYYAKKKSGKYQLAGTTANAWYRVKDLSNNQAYYFKVKACAAKKASKLDGALSLAVSMTTQPFARTTIFAGDSITTGLTSYGTLDQIHIGGNKQVVASVGLNTTTFRTRREFSGRSALGTIIARQPYRVYIMLGTNEIHWQDSGNVAAGYKLIVQMIQSQAPNTDVVVLAVPPVTSATLRSRTGFAQIPTLNSRLKAMATELGVRYYDWTAVLKDANGCLQSRYAAGDGIHWTSAAYQLFAGQIEKYDLSLD